MKTKLLLLLSLIIGLSACFTNTSVPVQITSLNVDCQNDEVTISDDVIDLSGEQSWTAKCKGKTYTCTYLAESDMGCYEFKE